MYDRWIDIIFSSKLRKMKGMILAIIALSIGAMAYVGTDIDGDGVFDQYTIDINGISYDANHCIQEVLHASN